MEKGFHLHAQIEISQIDKNQTTATNILEILTVCFTLSATSNAALRSSGISTEDD